MSEHDAPIADTETLDERLARRLIADHPEEAARLLEQRGAAQVLEALRSAPVAAAAAVLEALERNQAAAALAGWPDEQRAELVRALGPALAARLLRCLDAASRDRTLAGCDERVAGPIRRLTRYAEGSAGAMMNADPPAAPEDLTVGEARALLERSPVRTGGSLFVVTRHDVLVGVVEIDDLLRASPDAALPTLARPAAARVAARADRDAVAQHPGWRQHHILPVVDRHEVLVGAIDHRALHTGEAGPAAAEPPLGLALGELYWTLTSSLLEAVVRAVRPGTSGEVRR